MTNKTPEFAIALSNPELVTPLQEFRDSIQPYIEGSPKHLIAASPTYVSGKLSRMDGTVFEYMADNGQDGSDFEDIDLARISIITNHVITDKSTLTRLTSLEIIAVRTPKQDNADLVTMHAQRTRKDTRESTDYDGTITATSELAESVDIKSIDDLKQRLRWSMGKIAMYLAD
jgi:hypothetical protein